MSVAVPLFQSKGLSFGEIFYLQAIFGATIGILEVPSGYIADLFGRKNTLILGTVFDGLGLTYLYFATGFYDLVFFEILLGIGMSLISGIDLAILYDSIEKSKNEKMKKTKALSNMRFYVQIASAFGAVVGGFLASQSFDLLVKVQLVIGWLPLVVAMSLFEPKIERMGDKHKENFKDIFFQLFKSDKLLRLTMINWVVWCHSTYFGYWMLQKYWENIGIAIVYFGVIYAIYQVVAAIFSKYAYLIEEKHGVAICLWSLSVLPVIGYLSIAYIHEVWGVIFALCFAIPRGITQVILIDALNSRVPDKMRATANSINSLMLRIGFILAGPVIGFLLERYELSSVSLMLSLTFIVCSFILIPQLIKEIEKNEKNDSRI